MLSEMKNYISRMEFSWKMLLVAIFLVVVGLLLMLQSSNMLFGMNPLSIGVMGLALLFIFSGIALLVVAVASMASV
ncbi:MAG: hypothetical protein QME50_02645 [Candidatus Bathyarchaeota archaeon]|nr:hypothetical protein [Candidatus Bathyarchaeota archaeon]